MLLGSFGPSWGPLGLPGLLRLSWVLLDSLDFPGLSWALLCSHGFSWAILGFLLARPGFPGCSCDLAVVGSPGLVWTRLGMECPCLNWVRRLLVGIAWLTCAKYLQLYE